MHTEIHTAEPLVPEPRVFEYELAIEDIKSHKSAGIDQIPAELFKTGGRKISNEIRNIIISIWNKEDCVRSGRSPSLCVSIRSVIKQIVVIIAAYPS